MRRRRYFKCFSCSKVAEADENWPSCFQTSLYLNIRVSHSVHLNSNGQPFSLPSGSSRQDSIQSTDAIEMQSNQVDESLRWISPIQLVPLIHPLVDSFQFLSFLLFSFFLSFFLLNAIALIKSIQSNCWNLFNTKMSIEEGSMLIIIIGKTPVG